MRCGAVREGVGSEPLLGGTGPSVQPELAAAATHFRHTSLPTLQHFNSVRELERSPIDSLRLTATNAVAHHIRETDMRLSCTLRRWTALAAPITRPVLSRSPFTTTCTSSSLSTRRVHSASPTVSSAPTSPSSPFVLVYGGNGALGQAMVDRFKAGRWRTISVDYYENSRADHNVLLDKPNDWKTNTEVVTSALTNLATTLSDEQAVRTEPGGGEGEKAYLSAVIGVAGGWKGSTISSHALFDSVDVMIASNVLSSLACAHIASHYLLPQSLLLLTGASAAASPAGTPSMIGYGMSKAAVHHLTLSLSAHDSEMTRRGIRVACLLPVTIDTPSNRQMMGTGDYSDWTPTQEFADYALAWARQTEAGKSAAAGEEAEEEEETTGERAQQSGGERHLKHAGGKAAGKRRGLVKLVSGGFYEFRTSKNVTSVNLLDDPLTLEQHVVAQ